jgi:hypothetical protein
MFDKKQRLKDPAKQYTTHFPNIFYLWKRDLFGRESRERRWRLVMMNLDNEQFEFANSIVHICFASMP